MVLVQLVKQDRDLDFLERFEAFLRETPRQYDLLKRFPLPEDFFSFRPDFAV